MKAIYLSSILGDDLLPPNSAWTDFEQKLSDILSAAISDLILDSCIFVKRILQTLNPDGDCQGLGWVGDLEGQKTLLCLFLDSAGRFAAYRDPSLQTLLPTLRLVIDRWNKELKELAGTSEWQILGIVPPVENVYLYFQYRIAEKPAYRLIAAPFQRGLSVKAHQLKIRDSFQIRKCLADSVGWIPHIAENIPASEVRELLSDYAPGEWDSLTQTTIHKLPKIRGTANDPQYTEQSQRTLTSDWRSGFYALSRQQTFRSRAGYIRELLAKEPIRADDRLRDEGEKSPETRLSLDQFAAEDRDLLEDGKPGRKIKSMKAGNEKKAKYQVYPGYACILGNPSSAMPGVLPEHMLAHIYGKKNSDQAPEDKHLNMMEIAFFSLLLHLGRPVEWLLTMRLGDRSQIHLDWITPLYDQPRHSFFFVPERYLCFPDRFHPKTVNAAKLEQTVQLQDISYEHVDLIHQIILPPRLARLLDEAILFRNELVDQAIFKMSGLGCTMDTGPMWLCPQNGYLGVWDESTVSALFLSLTERLRRENDRYPVISPAHFTRSFQGYYAELGLRSEYRYHLSGRITFGTEVPLHYSQFSAEQVYLEHAKTCEKLFEIIIAEQQSLGLTSDIDLSPVGTFVCDPHDFLSTGSRYVVRRDVLVRIISYLRGCLDRSVDWTGALSTEQAHFNALVRWTAVVLAVLTGLRPREIIQLQARHVDLEGGRIAIQGKPHLAMPGYRRVPILRELRPFLSELIKISESHKTSHLFGLYDPEAGLSPLKTSDLDDCMFITCQRLFMEAAPDFYSLRHRFRTDLLAQEMNEHFLNYLMGHEGYGCETFNGYLDRSLNGLIVSYENAARTIAELYRIFQ